MSLRPAAAIAAATALSASLALAAPQAASAAPAATASAARAATFIVPTGGATTLAIAPGTAQVLTDNGISVAPVSQAKVTGKGIAFPIQGGLVNATTLAGRITHSGGLMFSAGGKDLTVRDFTINTRKGGLTAYVEEVGKRIRLLDLRLGKAKVDATKKRVKISNVGALLSDKAAAALNDYYSTDLFAGGLKIGTATVKARIKVLRG
ncbi:hypothetical protein E8D34_10590 [Nocardioides sp. GY 10113]|uniref:HtaA domain-containing protein n=1 Tax=Nocardioides sp. GY 10113 TaxID=2569761 RepID=UPI0010A886DD|nr:HtaA domain-containing protein [Nocardioides sp. GY 10113]TIC87552.1 hypothetical protein E8D34_10590 [Nocardioides sp. GY 10113]